MKSHSAENRFPLHYYSGNSKASLGVSTRCSEVCLQERGGGKETLLTVDSRAGVTNTEDEDDSEDEDCADPLERAIQTK